MKHRARYQYVVHPGMASGIAFVTAYEIEDFHSAASSDLPAPMPLEARRSSVVGRWTRTATRFTEAFRRRFHVALRRKAAA